MEHLILDKASLSFKEILRYSMFFVYRHRLMYRISTIVS